MEGSNEVVVGGAYAWSKLKPANHNKQMLIHTDYIELVSRVRAILRNENSPDMEKFEQSYNIVLNCIMQDTLLWVPGLKDVIHNIKTELDLQQLYMSDFSTI